MDIHLEDTQIMTFWKIYFIKIKMEQGGSSSVVGRGSVWV